MSTFIEFHVEYDKNRGEGSDTRLALMLTSAASEFGGLYVDFYAAADDVMKLPQNKHVVFDSTASKPSLVSKLLNVKEVSTYVCVAISHAQQLVALWKDHSYSTPKLYRLRTVTPTVSEGALEGDVIDKFQWAPLAELASLLDANVCLLRDSLDEIGFEVICREGAAERMKYLLSHHLDKV